MTFQSLCILNKMKSMQNSQTSRIEVDTFCGTLCLHGPNGKNEVLLPKWLADNFETSLNELTDGGYIKEDSFIDGCVLYSITYKGQHLFQLWFQSFLSFLGKSILVPIAVSIITTVIVNRLLPPLS